MPLKPAPATRLTAPPGATSDSLANQFATGALELTLRWAGETEDFKVFGKRFGLVDQCMGIRGPLVRRGVTPPHDRAPAAAPLVGT